jgi:anti-sigma-K factor RskA
MNGHPTREEDFDLYALGALEGEERKALEAHLAACPECARKMEEASGRMALLAFAVPPQAPDRAVKQRLMQRVAQSQRASPISPQEISIPLSLWSRPMAWAMAALLLAIASAFLWTENNRMKDQLRALNASLQQLAAEAARNRELIELASAKDSVDVVLAPAACTQMEGHVRYNPRQGLLVFTGNLPALPADKIYELWLVRESGTPISAGIFNSDATGTAAVVLPSLPAGVAAKAFAVTVEPAGGKPQPTGNKVLIGSLS